MVAPAEGGYITVHFAHQASRRRGFIRDSRERFTEAEYSTRALKAQHGLAERPQTSFTLNLLLTGRQRQPQNYAQVADASACPSRILLRSDFLQVNSAACACLMIEETYDLTSRPLRASSPEYVSAYIFLRATFGESLNRLMRASLCFDTILC